MHDYDVLGDGYGVNPEGDGVRWIFWSPGCKTKEGFITWDELGCDRTTPFPDGSCCPKPQ